MHARVVYTWGGKSVLFREVSSVQECPYTKFLRCMFHTFSHYITLTHTHTHTQDNFLAVTGKKGHSMKTMLRDLHLELEGRHHSGIDDSRNIAKILRTLTQQDPHGLGSGLVQPKLLKKTK